MSLEMGSTTTVHNYDDRVDLPIKYLESSLAFLTCKKNKKTSTYSEGYEISKLRLKLIYQKAWREAEKEALKKLLDLDIDNIECAAELKRIYKIGFATQLKEKNEIEYNKEAAELKEVYEYELRKIELEKQAAYQEKLKKALEEYEQRSMDNNSRAAQMKVRIPRNYPTTKIENNLFLDTSKPKVSLNQDSYPKKLASTMVAKKQVGVSLPKGEPSKKYFEHTTPENSLPSVEDYLDEEKVKGSCKKVEENSYKVVIPSRKEKFESPNNQIMAMTLTVTPPVDHSIHDNKQVFKQLVSRKILNIDSNGYKFVNKVFINTLINNNLAEKIRQNNLYVKPAECDIAFLFKCFTKQFEKAPKVVKDVQKDLYKFKLLLTEKNTVLSDVLSISDPFAVSPPVIPPDKRMLQKIWNDQLSLSMNDSGDNLKQTQYLSTGNNGLAITPPGNSFPIHNNGYFSDLLWTNKWKQNQEYLKVLHEWTFEQRSHTVEDTEWYLGHVT